MSSSPLPTGRAEAMASHLAGVAIIKDLMSTRRDQPLVPLSESGIRIVEPDAATIERAKVVQAAAAERAAKAAAAPPPPPPRPQGPGADQDPRYSETTRWALGVANTARKDLEDLQVNVRAYNAFKTALEDPAHLDYIRSGARFEESVTRYFDRLRNYVAGFGSTAQQSAEHMSRDYRLSGAPLTQDAAGFLSINDFTMTTTGPSWTFSMTSTGVATVFAGGEDVSALVDNYRMTGELWFSPAPGQTNIVV